MARHKKNAQQHTKGCRLCGNPGFGRGIRSHVEGTHGLSYKAYRQCFENSGRVIQDELVQAGHTHGGRRVMLHISVKRFLI